MDEGGDVVLWWPVRPGLQQPAQLAFVNAS